MSFFRGFHVWELETLCTVLYVGLFFLCFGLSTSLFCVLIFFSSFSESHVSNSKEQS